MDIDPRRVEAIVQVEGAWRHFARPSRVVQTYDASRVGYTISAVEELTLRGESSAVGFVTYEAGAAFGLQVHVSSDLPLAWFAVFDTQPLRLDNLSEWCRSDPASLHRYLSPTPTRSAEDFAEAFNRIKARIADGETCQANYRFRLEGMFSGQDARRGSSPPGSIARLTEGVRRERDDCRPP